MLLTSVVIRIRKFLGLSDPDTDQSLYDRIRILPSSSKESKKDLDFYCFVTSFGLLSLKIDVKEPSRSNRQKELIFC